MAQLRAPARVPVVNGYRIERVLGSGGFGVTYLARDLLQQPFAIKEYYPRQFAVRQALNVLAASSEDAPLFEECRERFLREAQALVVLGRLAGANDGIVRVQTYFEANGTCFLVMDYVEGASLASILQREPGGLAAPRVQSLLAQLLSAIGGVHRAGLMHRDIKPANIILRDDDRVVLIDFGSSRATTSGLTTDYTKIYSGGYAPPEQMLGMRQGAFSDIYAIGAVCYRAIGGTVVDGQARQIALTVGRPDPQPSASQIGAGRYPGPLLATIDAALTIDATKRPQSIDAMLAALGQDEPAVDATVMAAHRPVPATAPQLHPQPSMRRRGVLGVIAGLGALVVIATTYIELRSPATPPAGQPDVVTSMQASGSSPPVVTPQRQEHSTESSTVGGVAPPVTAAGGTSDTAPPHPPTGVPAAEAPRREAITVPAPAPPPSPTTPLPTTPSSTTPAPTTPSPTTPAPTTPEDAPRVAPAPVSPAEPPQRQAMAVPAPPPAPRPAASPPASAPAPASPSPVEQPQRQAMVVPPPAPLPTSPQSRLEFAQAEARSLPCSILHIAKGPDALRVSGLAPAGQELNRLLTALRGLGRVADNVTRVGRFACGPIAAVDSLVRQTWDAAPPPLAIRLDQREVASGRRLGIDVATTLPTLYVDLYQSDGSVRHLLRPAPSGEPRSGKPGEPHAEWIAVPPPGPRLVVAIGSATPLDLGARPDTERAAEYLAILQTGLQRSAAASSADVAMVTVHAVEPGVVKGAQPYRAKVLSGRCANIVSRAQLGETLSDAERATLRTECRS